MLRGISEIDLGNFPSAEIKEKGGERNAEIAKYNQQVQAVEDLRDEIRATDVISEKDVAKLKDQTRKVKASSRPIRENAIAFLQGVLIPHCREVFDLKFGESEKVTADLGEQMLKLGWSAQVRTLTTTRK